MKRTIILFSMALFAIAANAQVQDTIAPVQYQEEEPEITVVEEVDIVGNEHGNILNNLNFDYYATAEMDTIPKYRREIFPYIRAGFGNLAADNQFANSDFGYLRSASFQWGVNIRQPFSKESNLLGLRYGLAFTYNAVSPTDNRIFYVDGNQTNLLPADRDLRKDNTVFRNSYIEIPRSLKYDNPIDFPSSV